jgi:photosystem II stability/assembly factor-like uncharacterized protein
MYRLIGLLSIIFVLSLGVSSGSLELAPSLPLTQEDSLAAWRRQQAFHTQRAFPQGDIPADWQLAARAAINKMPLNFAATNWQLRPRGPQPLQLGRTFGELQPLTGRVTALATPQPDIVYLGAAQGGVWRSTDGGQVWQPLLDDRLTQSIGTITVDPQDPRTIYVGTGEGNNSQDSFFGLGILKSTDAGDSWQPLAATTFAGLGFSQLIIDPQTPQTLYAAVSALAVAGINGGLLPRRPSGGVYRSTDGGHNWQNISPIPERNANSVQLDPLTPSTLYAGFTDEGIFKSTDRGQSWEKLRRGLPATGFGVISLAVAPSQTQTLYAALEARSSRDLQGIFRSTNGGQDWQMLTAPPLTSFGRICQCFFDNLLVVSPLDPTTIYFGGVGLYKSTNGGQSWRDLSARQPGMHEDFHALSFLPGAAESFYVGNDGGVWLTVNGGELFTNRNSNLNITQFQSLAIDPTNEQITFGGTQDNGTTRLTGDNWQQVDIGDGGAVVINPTNPQIIYHTYANVPGGFVGPVRSGRGGEPGSWQPANRGIDNREAVLLYPPLLLDPFAPNTLYFGTNRLYQTTDQGANWQALASFASQNTPISTISIGNAPVIYVGTAAGKVLVSLDRGKKFTEVTGNLPPRYITTLTVNPITDVVLATVSGFGSGHIFRSSVGQSQWQDISGNLPDVPANALAINPRNFNNMFLATDLGLFVTFDGGQNWQPVAGLPSVSVFALAMDGKARLLRAATHGRGVYELTLAESNFTAPLVTVSAPMGGKKFPPGTTIELTWQVREANEISKQEIRLSIDGGATFPLVLAPALNGQQRTALLRLPQMKTKQAILRVLAQDVTGNIGQGQTTSFKIK